MDIQVGDRVTYKVKRTNSIMTMIAQRSDDIKSFYNTSEFEILKIERPKYETIEEKKELLSDREKYKQLYDSLVENIKDKIKENETEAKYFAEKLDKEKAKMYCYAKGEMQELLDTEKEKV